MPIVRLGNRAAVDNGQVLDGERVSTIVIPPEDSHDEQMRTIIHGDGLWARISAAPPSWVESDDPDLEAALAEHFNCRIGELEKVPDDARELTE